MYCKLGNVRAVLEVGRNERKSGRVPSSLLGGEAAPKSNSSQTQVSASPFGSVTLPVSVKGVLAGNREVAQRRNRRRVIAGGRHRGAIARACGIGDNLFQAAGVKI